MLNEAIQKINSEFINEAINSPNLIEDMASMEMYMSESYSGRIFAELLQNADDCGSSKILLTDLNRHMVFANNGRCFNEEDIVAISRSGASHKERGKTIGYRGIGFKSTTYLTNEIIIYSNNVYFTFSKSKCSKVLNKSEDKIPTVRIPFVLSDVDSDISLCCKDLITQGYSSVFIFTNAKTDTFIEELEEVGSGYFLFLKHIKHCNIMTKEISKSFSMNRRKIKAGNLIEIDGKLEEKWLLVSEGTTSLGLKYNNNKIVPCDVSDAVYHCYLPTYDKMSFLLKANGDFSTDSSRKHLTYDELTEYTLCTIADLLFSLLQSALISEDIETYSCMLELLMQSSSFSKANLFLRDQLKSRVLSTAWLTLNDNKQIYPDKYKLLPDWLEDSENMIIRMKSKYVNDLSLDSNTYKSIVGIDRFLSQYSNLVFSTDDFVNIIEDVNFVSSINSSTYGKILANIIKAGRTEQFISGKQFNFSKVVIITDNGLFTIGEIANNKNMKIVTSVKEAINQIASFDEIEWFCNNESVSVDSFIIAEQALISQHSTIEQKPLRPVVNKWRSAEHQCIEMENYLGNKAVDVSKQNLGYDVESTTKSGEKRYIEVKLLQNTGSAFSLTNNEYTAAHQYGENYFICLIMQSENRAKFILIKNPLETVSFEKRVRQWEWYCEHYSGIEYSVDVK